MHTPHLYSPSELLILGLTTFRAQHRTFGMLAEDRLRHLYLLGKTGSGKSTLMLNLLAQDLASGAGCALLDPHGDLFDRALALVPRSRTNQVVVMAPDDRDFPVAFNMLRQGRRTADRALLASHLVSLLKSQWSEFWGPRLEHLLRNAVLAVCEHPQGSLLMLHRFLASDSARTKLVARVQDPIVRAFWEEEFAAYKPALQEEMLSPVRNKLGAFVGNPAIRPVVCQVKSRLDMRALMDEGGVLLARLPSGTIGQDSARLLGGLLLSSIQLAAMSRPAGARPFYVYVDEFQNFVSEALPTMLSEARKFGLALTLANQYLGQLTPGIRGAALGNVGSLLVFRVGAGDAKEIEEEFAPVFTARDLEWLPAHEVAAKLLVHGRALAPFSGRTLPPPPEPPRAQQTAERILAQSRRRFATPRVKAEDTIRSQLA